MQVNSPYGRTGRRTTIEFDGACLAVISDIHGNLPALEVAVQDAFRRGAQLILCAGDVVGYGPWPQSCIDYLQDREVRSVQGNYDRGVGEGLPDCGCVYRSPREEQTGRASLEWTSHAVSDAGRLWLKELPFALDIAGPGGQLRVTIFHGSLRRVNEYLYADRPQKSLAGALEGWTAPVAVCGHTHIPYSRTLPGHRLLVNCGSVGRPRHGHPTCTYALLHLDRIPSLGSDDSPDTSVAHIVEAPYASARASSAVLASGLPEDFAAMLRTGQGG